jgi:hypothetical protein
MVASPSDVLKAMPAATIQKIEVITVSPSKYDGEGLTGIINIITSTLSQQGQKSEGGSGDFFNRRFNYVTSTYSALVYAPDSLAESYRLLNTGSVNAGAWDPAVGYQLRFGRLKEGSLNLSYRYAATNNREGNMVTVSGDYNYSDDYTQANRLQTKGGAPRGEEE